MLKLRFWSFMSRPV